MGNTPSQTSMSPAVASNLSPRAQQRLSQSLAHSPYMNFFEAAAVAPNPTAVRRKKKPNDGNSIRSSTTHSSGSSNGKQQNDAIKSVNEKRPSQATALSDSSTLTPAGDVKLDYITREGRRYIVHPDVRFFLPVDQDETDRLVILHFLLKYAVHNSLGAPVHQILEPGNTRTRPQILNVGCGSGTWVLEMANDYPHADVYGIDLRPMFPSAAKPSNAKFIHHNFVDGLPFANNTFDYVHMRLMLCNLTQPQLVRMLSEIGRVLRPMGYIEILDVDYRVQRPGPLCDLLLNQKLHAAFLEENIDLHMCNQLSTLLMTQATGAGFINVHQKRTTIPLVWGGQLGHIHGQNMESFYRSVHPMIRDNAARQPSSSSVSLNQQLGQGLNDTTIQHLMTECEKYQSHLNWYICYGQKPFLTQLQQHHILQPSHTQLPVTAIAPKVHQSPLTPPSQMPTPSALPPSPTTSMATNVTSHHLEETTWESINHFVDGYTE